MTLTKFMNIKELMLWQHVPKLHILKSVMVAKINQIGVNGGIMNKELSIHDVASWFLDKEAMSQKKLQKLCYYAVAWGYALLNDPIVKNPEFQAWVHGPVSPTLWKSYSAYGWNNIDKKQKYWTDNLGPRLTQLKISTDVADLLESVWLTYGSKSGNELEALSHKETPWINARKNLPEYERSTEPLSPSDMRAYYQSIYISE